MINYNSVSGFFFFFFFFILGEDHSSFFVNIFLGNDFRYSTKFEMRAYCDIVNFFKELYLGGSVGEKYIVSFAMEKVGGGGGG